MDLQHEQRLTVVEQRAKSNSHRIEQLEKITTEIHELSKNMLLLCEQSKNTSEDVRELKNRVGNIEDEPGSKHRFMVEKLWGGSVWSTWHSISGRNFIFINTCKIGGI